MSVLILDPAENAPTGRVPLDCDNPQGAIRVQQNGIDWGDAAIQEYLADARVGSVPVDFRVPNRTIKVPLGLGMDDSGLFDVARRALQAKVGRFEEEGGTLKRQVEDGTFVYADVVSATLTLPDKFGEAAKLEDSVTLQLECLPDFYTDEIVLDPLTGKSNAQGVAMVGGSTNWIFNPSFAHDAVNAAPAGWVGNGGAAWHTLQVQAVGGANVLRLTTPVMSNGQVCQLQALTPWLFGRNGQGVWVPGTAGVANTMPCIPGLPLSLQLGVDVLAVAGSPKLAAVVTFYDCNSAEVSQVSTPLVTVAGEATPTLSTVVPANASSFTVALQVTSGAANTSMDLYVNGGVAVRFATEPSYSDGDQEGFEWTGTPGNSQSGQVAVIEGDMTGRVRQVIQNPAGVKQALLWGMRSKRYDPSATAALRYDCADLSPLDAATVQPLAGSVSGFVVEHPNLSAGAWVPVLATTIAGLGEMTHRGTYRVILRYTSSSAQPIMFQLLWGIADVAQPVQNPLNNPDVDDFYLCDLGVIRLDPSPASGYWWKGVIQAQGSINGQDVELDELMLIPLDDFAGWASTQGQQLDSQTPPLTGISEGPNYAGTAADGSGIGTAAWSNPGNAVSQQPPFASVVVPTAGGSHYLKLTGFDFNIPPGATIVGVGVGIQRHASARASVFDAAIRLLKAGAVQATDRSNKRPWQAVRSGGMFYGSVNDMWGTTLAPADVNNANFGLAIAVKNEAAGQETAYVKAVAIQIFYTSGGGFTDVQDAVIYAGCMAELRTEGAFRQEATGQAFGNIAVPGGDVPRIPASGDENRPLELIARATSYTTTQPGNYSYFEDSQPDPLIVQLIYRPCYLFRP